MGKIALDKLKMHKIIKYFTFSGYRMFLIKISLILRT